MIDNKNGISGILEQIQRSNIPEPAKAMGSLSLLPYVMHGLRPQQGSKDLLKTTMDNITKEQAVELLPGMEGMSMDALESGTMVIMVKNEDGTFSPVAMSKEQARILNAFLSGLSKDEPFTIIGSERYGKERV